MNQTRMLRLLLAVSLSCAIAGGVSACAAPASTPEPTRAPATTPAPDLGPSATPTPTAPAGPVPARLLVTAESLAVLASDGQVQADYDYRGLTSEVVNGLSNVLGTPELVPFGSGNHNGTGIGYHWDGFALMAEDRWATLPEQELPDYLSRWYVVVDGPSARGLVVETIDGIRVGDPTPALVDQNPGAAQRTEGSGITSRWDVYLGAVAPPIAPDSPNYNPGYRWRVWLLDEDPTDTIQRFVAPSPSYGA